MDDSLSALDVNVASFVMNQMILSKMKNKTRIIATHNLNYLSHFDRIMILDEGKIIFFGSYVEI